MTLPLFGKLTAAILLIIKLVLLEQLVTTFVESALAPVLLPELSAGNGLLGFHTCGGNLLNALPTGRGQGGSKETQTLSEGFLSSTGQPHQEALTAATAPFRLPLQSLHTAKPKLVVIVTVYPA